MSVRPPAFDLLFTVPDLPFLLFSGFDPSSLALAACVCKRWRELALQIRDIKATEAPSRFQLSFRALVHRPVALAWAVDNLGEKHLPPKLRDEACLIAAQEGALEALQWARENGCEWDWRTCVDAAEYGHLAVLQWARKNGCPWGADICAYAARGGHLAILQWARENGCEWNSMTCAYAARGGHLSVLQWARENGCEWGAWTCTDAAMGGHLAVLQWARENGCDWNKADCLRIAKQDKHEVMAAWIETQQE
jgi:hypothetical protein